MEKMDLVTENYQLKWHSFGTHLHGCVAAALNNDCFTDVALITMDGRQILAHRFILSACSQYLHEVLKLQTKINSSPLIIVLPPEINYKTLRVLIQYMYSGEATVSQAILESVLRGGDLLKVKGLWRPREEESNEKRINVKLHQKVGNTQTPQPSVIKDSKKETDDSTKNRLRPENKSEEVKPQSSTKVKETVIKTYSKEDKNKEKNKNKDAETKKPVAKNAEDSMQVMVIKEEPIEWSEVNQEDIELVEHSDMFETEMTIKPEIIFDDEEEEEEEEDINEELYTPLTCELCSETYTQPADWVKHVQTHTDMMPAKRQKRGRSSFDEDNGTFPPLQCDMCQEFFPTPAQWVQHIQHAHTEQEMRDINSSIRCIRSVRSSPKFSGPTHKVCSLCNKQFPSHASMLIHKRTHTGERPYMCDYCYKGFNVKSNLLRHLRTLHDKFVNPTDIESKDDDANDIIDV